MIGAFTTQSRPELLPAVVVQRFGIGVDSADRRTDQIHCGRGHNACPHACRGDAQLINFIHQRRNGFDGFLRTRDLRRNQDVHRAVLVHRCDGISGDRTFRNSGNRDLNAVLPDLDFAVCAKCGEICIGHFAQTDRHFNAQTTVLLEVLISQVFISCDLHLGRQDRRLQTFRLNVFGDLGNNLSLQRSLVAVGGFGIGSNHSIHLGIGDLAQIHVLVQQILSNDCGNIGRLQRCGQRTAFDFLISHDKGCHTIRCKAGNIHALFFCVIGNISHNIAGLEERHIRAFRKLLITGNETGSNLRCQP